MVSAILDFPCSFEMLFLVFSILICFKKGSSKLEDSFADSDLGLNNTVRPKALDITDAAIYFEPYFSISSFAILNNWPPILIVFFSKSMV